MTDGSRCKVSLDNRRDMAEGKKKFENQRLEGWRATPSERHINLHHRMTERIRRIKH